MQKGTHQWYSLNGVIPESDYTRSTSTDENNKTWYTYSISTAGQLAKLNNEINDFISGDTSSDYLNKDSINKTIYGLYGMNIKIELTADIDMMGSALNINLKESNFIFEGNGHTLTGIVNIRDFAVSNNNTNKIERSYGSGIIGYAYNTDTTTNPSIVFNNLTVTNSYFGAPKLSGSGVLVGFSQGCDITVSSVNIDNCSLLAGKGAGAVTGYLSKANLTFTGKNTISNVTLQVDETAGEGCVAGVCGRFVLREAAAYVTVACESFSDNLDGNSVLQLDVNTITMNNYRSGVWFYADTSSEGDGYAVNDLPNYSDGTMTYEMNTY